MTFVQLIEFQTQRIDEIDAAINTWIRESEGWRAPTRSLRTKLRDRDDAYLEIVEFPSYEEAMANSDRPETRALAASLQKLCDAPPVFTNLDVRREDNL